MFVLELANKGSAPVNHGILKIGHGSWRCFYRQPGAYGVNRPNPALIHLMFHSSKTATTEADYAGFLCVSIV